MASECNAVLVLQLDVTTLDQEATLVFINVIDETTWEQKRKDANFLAKLNVQLGKIPPFSASSTYQEFDEARRSYFHRSDYSFTESQFIQRVSRYLSSDQVHAWLQCMQSQNLYGFVLMERELSEMHVAFELRWIHPPNAPDRINIESELVGGVAVNPDVKPGHALPENTYMSTGSISFTIQRDPIVPLVINVHGGGFATSYSRSSSLMLRIDQLETNYRNLLSQLTEYKKRFFIELGDAPLPVSAHDGIWGAWTKIAMAPPGHYVAGIQVRFEASQGDGDDTAVNAVKLWCRKFPA